MVDHPISDEIGWTSNFQYHSSNNRFLIAVIGQLHFAYDGDILFLRIITIENNRPKQPLRL